jgi:nitronate monooxygenase
MPSIVRTPILGPKFAFTLGFFAGAIPKVMLEGDMDAGAWSCGMVVGLINDIPTVKELIDRIMDGANASSGSV